VSQTQTVQMDPYLAFTGAIVPPPPNPFEVDPQFGKIRMVTPIGRLAYVNLARPKSIKQQDGTMGPPIFSATILLNPSACGDLYRAIVKVASNRFSPETRPNPQNPSQMIQMTAEQMLFISPRQGGLHYPLRAGNESYMREPKKYDQWRELFFLNTSMSATNSKGNAQAPVIMDEFGYACSADKIYSGCYGRMQLTFFAFPKPGVQGAGSRGVGVILQAVQFARHGEKMGSFDASKSASDAFGAAGAIPTDPNDPNYGPNAATPASVPPGAVSGFAAPPPQQQPGQTQMPPQGGYVPPQNPMAAPPTGARPPGV
jgi:hypothetical protein